MNKTKLKVIAGVLAVFLLGGIIGGLSAGIYLRQRVEQFVRKAPKDHKDLFMERLSRELDLKESQKAEMEKIVTDSMIEVRELIQRSRIEFDQITERRNAQFKAILTPEQYRKLEKMEQRLRERWGRNPPPPPPPFSDGPPPGPEREPRDKDNPNRRPEQHTL